MNFKVLKGKREIKNEENSIKERVGSLLRHLIQK